MTSLPVTPGGTSGHLGGKTGDNWTQVQWNTRPRMVVNHYTGGDKTNGWTSGHHYDGLSSVSPEDRDICTTFEREIHYKSIF